MNKVVLLSALVITLLSLPCFAATEQELLDLYNSDAIQTAEQRKPIVEQLIRDYPGKGYGLGTNNMLTKQTPAKARKGAAPVITVKPAPPVIRAESEWKRASNNTPLDIADEVRTGRNSICEIILANRSIVTLLDLSHFTLQSQISSSQRSKPFFFSLVSPAYASEFSANTYISFVKGKVEYRRGKGILEANNPKKTGLKLLFGEMISNVKKLAGDEEFEVETPSAICGIRGTTFRLNAGPDGSKTDLFVKEGSVAFNNRSRTSQVLVGAGQKSSVYTGGSPAAATTFAPNEVDFAMASGQGQAAQPPAASPVQGKILGTFSNDGSGSYKTGGKVLGIASADLTGTDVISLKITGGTMKYITVHGRYPGGIWETIMQGSYTAIGNYELQLKLKALGLEVPGSYILSINGAHENYDPEACIAEAILIKGR